MSNERPLKEKSDDELTSLLWDDDRTWSLHAITSEIDLRMAEKDKEIERIKSSCVCAYCGKIQTVPINYPDEKLAVMIEHMAVCEKHPVPILLERALKAEAELAEEQAYWENAIRKLNNEKSDMEVEIEKLRERMKGIKYQDHEFCKDTHWVSLQNEICQAFICHKTAKGFHQWLNKNGYTIIKAISAAVEEKK
jgi:hypothetical protein